MTILSGLRGQTFASLASTNFRRYITGQAISQAGKWMQTIAQSCSSSSSPTPPPRSAW